MVFRRPSVLAPESLAPSVDCLLQSLSRVNRSRWSLCLSDSGRVAPSAVALPQKRCHALPAGSWLRANYTFARAKNQPETDKSEPDFKDESLPWT